METLKVHLTTQNIKTTLKQCLFSFLKQHFLYLSFSHTHTHLPIPLTSVPQDTTSATSSETATCVCVYECDLLGSLAAVYF